MAHFLAQDLDLLQYGFWNVAHSPSRALAAASTDVGNGVVQRVPPSPYPCQGGLFEPFKQMEGGLLTRCLPERVLSGVTQMPRAGSYPLLIL